MLQLKSTAWLLFMLAFCTCSEKKETSQHFFPKPPEEKLDSVGTWLDTEDNCFDTSFMTVFYTHFNKQMQANQVDSAAHLLDIAGSTMSMSDIFDTAFVKMNVAFIQQYGKQLSDRFETGIYLNIGDMYSNIGKFDSSMYYLQKVNKVPTDYYTLKHLANANKSLLQSALNVGQVDTAFAVSLRALGMYEDLADIKGQGAVYGAISCIYKYIENYQEAKIYLDKAQRLLLQTKDSSSINAVNGILSNLLKMKKLSLAKKDKNATANANTVVKNVIQELNVAIQSKALTIHNELSDDVVLPIAAEKLQIIVHNLLSNAVKYSFPNQQIRIYKEGKGFSIQDFGVGLSPEQRTKLMREVTASERGTSQERGNGLGLFLVGAMLQGEQLKVVFDSPEVGGTIAKVLG